MQKSHKKLTQKFKNKLPSLGETCFWLFWVLASIVSSQLFIGYPMLWLLGSDNFELPIWSAIYSALSYILALVLIIFIPPKLSQKWATNRESLGLQNLPTWTDIGLSPIGFVVGNILALLFAALFSFFPWFDANEAQNIGFTTYLIGGDRIIAFIALVVIAPIAEETIFRGWLYGKLRAKQSAPLAILLTSLLFALVHFQWNVGVNVFALSIVLCGLREITGTIYAGILTHMLKNGIAFYLLYIIGIS